MPALLYRQTISGLEPVLAISSKKAARKEAEIKKTCQVPSTLLELHHDEVLFFCVCYVS
jgi:hypothetical protein